MSISWELIEVRAADLKPNPRNPKKRDEKGFERLKKSLQKFGKVFDGIANRDLTLIDGHSRLEINGDEMVKVFIPSRQLTEKEYYEMNAIFDIAKAGEPDTQILEEIFEDEFFEEWDLTKPMSAAVEDDYEIPDEIQTDIVLGDLFEIGQHRLLCGDSTKADDVERLMNGQKADMVFTDPPYGVNYDGGHADNKRREKLKGDDSTDLYEPCCLMSAKFSQDSAPLYLWHAGVKGIAAAAAANKAGYEIRCEIVWNKQLAQFGAIGAQYKQKHEPCYYCFKRGKKVNWCGATNEVTVWDFDRSQKNEHHPTQKPVGLAAKAIGNHSVGIIADWFLGSGTTMVAAHQLNRKCYGMEIDPKYCQVIIDRMLKLQPDIKITRNGSDFQR